MWEWLDESNDFLMTLIEVDVIDTTPLKNQTVIQYSITSVAI